MSTHADIRPRDDRRELILVGGGHSHVQVLRHFMMEPPADLRTTLVVDTPIAVYSGMVPGFVAGQYARDELEIDVVPLARRAGVEVVLGRATAIDAASRRVEVEGRVPLTYDLASVDIGSTVIGLDLPGVREHSIPTRPISRLVRRVDELMVRREDLVAEPRVVVVGGGAGGVELAFTLDARLRSVGLRPAVTIVYAGERLLEGFPRGLGRRARRRAEARDIGLRPSCRVTSATVDAVRLDNGEELPQDILVWVAGATSHGILRASGLPTDSRGFVLTRPTLQVKGFDDLFAVGDCATLELHPRTPKAGVYAVRQGPYLIDNLQAAAAGRPLREYEPQADFLTLLNLGDGSAMGAKWGVSIEGRWVMRLKDYIDRKFMRLFQVLDDEGAPRGEFAEPAMEGDGMLCGGCAAKLGEEPLRRALQRLEPGPDAEPVVLGPDAAEDVVAHRVAAGVTVVSSVDGFRPFSDDAFLGGRVAAVNAASDLLAKGVEPRFAQALVTVPERLDEAGREEYLFQTLAGARWAFDELGVRLLGGHTTTASEPAVAFHVEGVARGPLITKRGARPGDALVLTKPLGTGVVLFADMRGRCRGPWLAAAHASMLTPNAAAAEAMVDLGASAATDVTGFGLAGHLADLLRSSGMGGRLDLSRLPALPGVEQLLGRGERSTFHQENRRALRALRLDDSAREHPLFELLFDPQTSGGLLASLAAERADELVDRVIAAGGVAAARIGTVEERDGAAAFAVESY